MNRKLILLISSILILSIVRLAGAEIYKWTDDNGQVHFSDKPHEGATEVALPPVQVYRPGQPNEVIPADAANSSGEEKKDTQSTTSKLSVSNSATYESMQIVEPQNQATVRNNEGIVPMVATLSPTLKSGDKIVLLLDGKAVGEPQTNLSMTLTGIDRGAHSLAVQVINELGKVVIQSSEITFYMHRSFIRQN